MSRLQRVLGTNIIYVKDEEIRLGHTWHEVDVLDCLIEQEQPEWFVEVGLHEGGLSYMLIPAHPTLKYYGIEYDWNIVRKEVRKLYSDNYHKLVFADCFSVPVLDAVKAMPHKFIYCDGGNKVAELYAYKVLCAPGDCIFTHDYWDQVRKVRECPNANISIEVRPEDVAHMDTPEWHRISDSYLRETRIIGWRRI